MDHMTKTANAYTSLSLCNSDNIGFNVISWNFIN